MPCFFLARALPRALPLVLHGAVLAVLATACLPPDPFELAETIDEDPPFRGCRAYYEDLGSGRWQLARSISGSSTTTRPGELAAADFEITLSDWTSEHLLAVRMELEVVAGQALPAQTLVLRHGSELLQEAMLEGEHGNQAHFDIELPRELCGTGCTLQLSGPPAESDVPVPLKMTGTLFATVDAARETHPCDERELTLVVIDAP